MLEGLKTRIRRMGPIVRRLETVVLSPKVVFYVVSHERSGTHFVINTILKNTYIKEGWHNIGEWFGPYDEPGRRFEHIDAFNASWGDAKRRRSIIKSHCDRDLFEARYREAKVVYVLRDPRDTLTSWFHYLNRGEYYQNNPQVGDHRCESFTEFVRRPVSPFLMYCYSLSGGFGNVVERWASHVRGWLGAADCGRDILVVRYEELHRDYRTVLRRMAGFLGLRVKIRTHRVGLHDAPSVLPRKGVIGDWQTICTKEDEEFVRRAVEGCGLEWREVIDQGR